VGGVVIQFRGDGEEFVGIAFQRAESCFSITVHHKNLVVLGRDTAILKILSTLILCAFKYTSPARAYVFSRPDA
jgi:hypothetical protein